MSRYYKKEDMTGRSCLPFWVSLRLVAPPSGISMLGVGKAAPAQILRRYAAASLQCISAAGQKASRGTLAESLADLGASILTTPSKSEHTHFVAPLFQAKSNLIGFRFGAALWAAVFVSDGNIDCVLLPQIMPRLLSWHFGASAGRNRGNFMAVLAITGFFRYNLEKKSK